MAGGSARAGSDHRSQRVCPAAGNGGEFGPRRCRRLRLVLFDANDIWLPIATPILLQLPLALFLVCSPAAHWRDASASTSSTRSATSCRSRWRESSPIIRSIRSQHRGNRARDLPRHGREAFTALAECMTPEAAAAYLNQYFAALANHHRRLQRRVPPTGRCAPGPLHNPMPPCARERVSPRSGLAAIQRFRERNRRCGSACASASRRSVS